MPETQTMPKPKERLTLRHRVLLEARLRLLYAEAAQSAAEDGLKDLFSEYATEADEARERHDELKAKDAKLGDISAE